MGAPGFYADEGAPPVNGSVYIFDLVANDWVQTAKVQPAGLSAKDSFGSSCSLHDNWLVAGSPFKDNGYGAAYLFRRNNATDVWSPKPLLMQTDGYNFTRAPGGL